MNSVIATACPLTPRFLEKFWTDQPRRGLTTNSFSVLRFFVEMFFFTTSLSMDDVYEGYLDCVDDRNAVNNFADPIQLRSVDFDGFVNCIEALISFCAELRVEPEEPDDVPTGGSIAIPSRGGSHGAVRTMTRWHTEFGVLPLDLMIGR